MAMKTFQVGQVLAAADVNEYMVNTRFAIKPAATSRNTNTTLSNDPDLSITIDANKSYLLDAFIIFTSPTAANIKYAFTVPSGMTFTGYGLFSQAVSTFTGVSYSPPAIALTATEVALGTGSSIDDFISVRGVINTAGSGGSLTLQWAQNVSNGGNTIVRAGSSIVARRVA